MADVKTKQNNASVTAFLKAIDNKTRRDDAQAVHKMMREVTGNRAKMWGPSIVGYGSYDYTYESGRSGSFMLCGFSPRKQNLVVYIMPGFSAYGALMKRLGKFKTGKTCLFVTHSIPEAVYLSTRIVVMSPRPGRIIDVIDSPLPRERPLDIRETPEFLEVAHRVREGLRAGHSYED